MILIAVDAVPSILRAFELVPTTVLSSRSFSKSFLGAWLRLHDASEPPVLEVGDLVLDTRRRSVQNGRPIPLTKKQFDRGGMGIPG